MNYSEIIDFLCGLFFILWVINMIIESNFKE